MHLQNSRKALFLFVWIFLFAHTVHGGDLVPAKYAGEFMSIGVGARALGMGGAFVALSTDVTAGYWNPAGLAKIDYPQIILMHSERFGGIVKYDYGAFALPMANDASLGVSLVRLGIDGIPNTLNALIDKNGNNQLDRDERLDYNKVTWFSAAYYVLYLSYSKMANEKLFFGGNVKLIREGIGNNSAAGIGFDFAILYNPIKNFWFGAHLQDLTSTLVAWDTGRKELITPTLKWGLAYPFDISVFRVEVTPTIDIDTRFENRRYSAQSNLGSMSFDFHFGVEYNFKKHVALRLGSDSGKFTAGAGILLPKLQIDYAFSSHGDLRTTHRVSLKLTIEEAKFKRR